MSGSGTRRSFAAAAVLAAASLPLLGVTQAVRAAQGNAHRPSSAPVLHRQNRDSGPAVRHDTSLPLRELAEKAAPPPRGKRVAPDMRVRLPHPPASHRRDPVVQSLPGIRAAVATSASFDGLGASTGYHYSLTPPDPNAAVGTTQVVEVVNTAMAVYSKTGGTIMGATNLSALWSGFGGSCQSVTGVDPTVEFDKIADRWVIQQIVSSSPSFYECVAVSTSADATGTYNRYSFYFSALPDYPKLSVWPDAYYVTYHQDQGPEVCAMDRASMLTGAEATQQCYSPSGTQSYLLAADLDGYTLPPSGEAETVIGLATTTTLDYWRFHVDWVTPSNSTFTGPTALTVASYSEACGGSGACIPQGGSSETLASLGDRLMYRLAYRNFGDHESLVVSQSVTAGSGTGIRWYELRMSGGNPTVFQQGTYAPDSTFRWMPSIAMDHAGGIALGYSQSSSSTNPSIRFTGRLAGDPAGQMTQAETTVITGGGAQISTYRWGDYTSMQIDPVDDCTFWYTNEYSKTNDQWSTRLASFRLPGCNVTAGQHAAWVSDSYNGAPLTSITLAPGQVSLPIYITEYNQGPGTWDSNTVLADWSGSGDGPPIDGTIWCHAPGTDWYTCNPGVPAWAGTTTTPGHNFTFEFQIQANAGASSTTLYFRPAERQPDGSYEWINNQSGTLPYDYFTVHIS